MDSYSYRDGPGRSPVERGWSGRDDRGVKDESRDSFYRGRSPGAFGPSVFKFAHFMLYYMPGRLGGAPSVSVHLSGVSSRSYSVYLAKA